jgi:hypothetical protein
MFSRSKGATGKYKCNRKTRHFWSWYYTYAYKPIPYSKGKALYAELLHELVKMSIETGAHFYLPHMGLFCCVTKPVKGTIKKDNTVNINKVGTDWKATKELWKELYPGLTGEEIKQIPDRPRVKHMNKSGVGKKLLIHWLNRPKYMKFHPVTAVESLLGQKAKSGAIGITSNEDFAILVKTLTKRRGKKKNV